MQDDEVASAKTRLISLLALGNFSLRIAMKCLEAVDAVRRAGIVLDVARPKVLGRRLEIFWFMRLVVEIEHGLLVRLGVGCVGRQRCSSSNAMTSAILCISLSLFVLSHASVTP